MPKLTFEDVHNAISKADTRHRAEIVGIKHKINEEIQWHKVRLKDEVDQAERLRTRGIIAGLRYALSYFPERYDWAYSPTEQKG